jgi:hypothetical protein
MKTQMPDKDWKTLQGMKDRLLQVECERALDRINTLLNKGGENAYEVYLELWKALQDEDEKISRMFDDLRRNNAYFKMAEMVRFGLLASTDLEGFTQDTRDIIENISAANASLKPTVPTAGSS